MVQAKSHIGGYALMAGFDTSFLSSAMKQTNKQLFTSDVVTMTMREKEGRDLPTTKPAEWQIQPGT